MPTASRRPRTRRAPRQPVGSAGRSRLMLLGAVVVAAVVLFAWFPAGSLLDQRSNLAATEAQLAALKKQDGALAQEKRNLSDASEIGRIARAQYQLVSPSQQAYEVLPPSGAASVGIPYSGDPGSTGPVAPSATPELPPGGVTTATAASSASGHTTPTGTSSGSGLLSRMLHTLEFWR